MVNEKKILLITNEQRRGLFQEALEGHNVAYVTDPDPDYLETLRRYDGHGYEVAFIDDAATPDPDRCEAQIMVFISTPRSPQNRLRVVFLARSDMRADDPKVTRLISKGIYDIVLPSQIRDAPLDKILQTHLQYPFRYSDIARLDRKAVGLPSYDPKQAPRARYDKDGLAAASKERIVGQRTIGVIGATRYAGTSHIAQIIAHSLALAGYTVSLVTPNQSDISNLKSVYNHNVSEEGVFRIVGVDIYKGSQLADTNELQQFTVFDYQVFLANPKRDKEGRIVSPHLEAYELTKLWKRCDCKVVVSGSSPNKVVYLEDVFEQSGESDINKWNIAFNLVSDRLLALMQEKINTQYPNANVMAVHELNDPMASPDIPDFVQQLFMHSFGSELLNTIGPAAEDKKNKGRGIFRRA